MPFKLPKNLVDRIKEIPRHGAELPEESDVPVRHHERSANDSWNLLLYFNRNIAKAGSYRVPLERHTQRLRGMVLLGLVSAFERFLKELAAVCVDHVGELVVDKRLDILKLDWNILASHFNAGSFGKALCESMTWVDCDQVNDRFRKVLADHHKEGEFFLFPRAIAGKKKEEPATLLGRYQAIQTIWQLRHSIVHNSGVVTRADAVKFKKITRRNVDSPRVLAPAHGDVWYVKLYLDETVKLVNTEVGSRLAALLTSLHLEDPSLFEPGAKAQELANTFQESASVNGETRTPAP